MRKFSRGDGVVFLETRHQPRINPALGEDSAFVVVHYMTVRESSKKGTLVLQTQSGEMHVTHTDNPNIRRARWWERWFHRDRFPQLNFTKARSPMA